MPKEIKASVSVSLRLPVELAAALQTEADKQGIPLATLIKSILTRWKAEQKQAGSAGGTA